MRVLVVSDIHANLAAFDAVLQKTRKDWDRLLCLGDLVGYGPDPVECIARVQEFNALVLGGNHDLAAAGTVDLSSFADHARNALEWTLPYLSAEDRAYLFRLVPESEYEGILLSHGSPDDPVWGYVFSHYDSIAAFTTLPFTRCFFGHTHIPSFFTETRDARGGKKYDAGYGEPDFFIETDKPNLRIMLNPGSVGFPRNEPDSYGSLRFHRAAARYALFDTRSGWWQFKRIEYDMRNTAKRMKKGGLW
jgi:predicted phosphodiesterase